VTHLETDISSLIAEKISLQVCSVRRFSSFVRVREWFGKEFSLSAGERELLGVGALGGVSFTA
jgi:hypothetical protein